MMTHQVYFYSPFSPTNITESNHSALLLIFILKELARFPQGAIDSPAPGLAPFDWARPASSALKLREHFSLLPMAFPALESHVPALYQNLYSPAARLVGLLEPYIMACQGNENLLLFLLKHQNELAVKPLLDKICPEGRDVLKQKIASSFRKRGYPFTRWTHSSKMP